jgi:hypothetical protein
MTLHAHVTESVLAVHLLLQAAQRAIHGFALLQFDFAHFKIQLLPGPGGNSFQECSAFRLTAEAPRHLEPPVEA